MRSFSILIGSFVGPRSSASPRGTVRHGVAAAVTVDRRSSGAATVMPAGGHGGLGLADGVLAEVEDRRGQHRVGVRRRARRRPGGRACRRRRERSPARRRRRTTAAVSSRSKPSRVPSRSIDVSRISPAPRSTASTAHATASSRVGVRPPWVVTSQPDRAVAGAAAGVDGHDHALRAELGGHLADQLGAGRPRRCSATPCRPRPAGARGRRRPSGCRRRR